MFQRLSTDLLQSGYSVRFRPGGFSMYPTIRDGEAVTVEPISAHEVRRGDILLYQTMGRVIAHRVVAISRMEDKLRFITRGDALGDCDKPIGERQVLGKVVSVERRGEQIRLTGADSRLRQMAHVRASRLKRRLPARLRNLAGSLREKLGRGRSK